MSADFNSLRQLIAEAISGLGRVLPNQAPILEFVHFNVLEGYQHLNFSDALKLAHQHTGQPAYLPDERFREYFKSGRITLEDLHDTLNKLPKLNPDEEITSGLKRQDVYVANLLHPIKPLTGFQLNWQIEHQSALRKIQPDIDASARERLLANGDSEDECLRKLWEACLRGLELSHEYIHPEELVDLEAERTVNLLRTTTARRTENPDQISPLHQQMRETSEKILEELLHRIGDDLTFRGFLKALSGRDLLDEVRPSLLRHLSAFLDQGMAAWHNPDRTLGFYQYWRNCARLDMSWIFEQMPDWKEDLEDLPDDPLDAIVLEFMHMGLNEKHWAGYLRCLVQELPGWSSMFNWRATHPNYDGHTHPISMVDYVAVRLVLERLYASRLCRQLWQIEASLDTLRWYFRRRRSEFFVRHTMFNRRLPEYLLNLTQRQLLHFAANPADYPSWKPLADIILTWQHSPMSDKAYGHTLLHHAWPLFRLSQYLGLDGPAIAKLNMAQLDALFDCMDRLDPDTRGYIWLQSFERNYREQLFSALIAHRQQGLATRNTRPEAQMVFCMDDREEGIRRHLEEHNPQIETLGAAGFFGVAISYTGLDDTKPSPLCPVVVTPAHKINEVAFADQLQQLKKHQLRRTQRIGWRDILHQHSRRSLLTPAIVTLAAPLSFSALLARSFAHIRFGKLSQRLRRWFDGKVKTFLTLQAESSSDATPANPRLGFTDQEQADRIFNFLRNINLQQNLATFVVMVGHGSISQNNPHMAAYDCGACSGRHGGPNARAFAAMANRPEVRALLSHRGCVIPNDTWFLGAEHNTADDIITWFDTDLIPAALKPAFSKLKKDVHYGSMCSAHERCRRLASAPQNAGLKKSLKHMFGRTNDFSQARPELGHMNHAAAVIGRRALTQGLFLDRRVFLISYNPLSDPEGTVLEGFLGLNAQVVSTFLDYYFCAVNNNAYGSGSKITHNATGLLGVMDGCSSDLRTGLAKQMVEIHEPMRPHVLVEAHIEVLTKIYTRQPLLQELVGNRWLLLSAIHPDTGEIHNFDPATGFVLWQGAATTLPVVSRSAEWYAGHTEPLPPAQVKREVNHA